MNYYSTLTEWTDQELVPALGGEEDSFLLDAIAYMATNYEEGRGFYQSVTEDELWEIVQEHENGRYGYCDTCDGPLTDEEEGQAGICGACEWWKEERDITAGWLE